MSKPRSLRCNRIIHVLSLYSGWSYILFLLCLMPCLCMPAFYSESVSALELLDLHAADVSFALKSSFLLTITVWPLLLGSRQKRFSLLSVKLSRLRYVAYAMPFVAFAHARIVLGTLDSIRSTYYIHTYAPEYNYDNINGYNFAEKLILAYCIVTLIFAGLIFFFRFFFMNGILLKTEKREVLRRKYALKMAGYAHYAQLRAVAYLFLAGALISRLSFFFSYIDWIDFDFKSIDSNIIPLLLFCNWENYSIGNLTNANNASLLNFPYLFVGIAILVYIRIRVRLKKEPVLKRRNIFYSLLFFVLHIYTISWVARYCGAVYITYHSETRQISTIICSIALALLVHFVLDKGRIQRKYAKRYFATVIDISTPQEPLPYEVPPTTLAQPTPPAQQGSVRVAANLTLPFCKPMPPLSSMQLPNPKQPPPGKDEDGVKSQGETTPEKEEEYLTK